MKYFVVRIFFVVVVRIFFVVVVRIFFVVVVRILWTNSKHNTNKMELEPEPPTFVSI